MVNTLIRFESCIAECSFIIPAGNSKEMSPEDIAQTVYIDLATVQPYQDGAFVAKGEIFWKLTRLVANKNE